MASQRGGDSGAELPGRCEAEIRRYSVGASLRRSMSQFVLTSPTSMPRLGGVYPMKRRSRYVALATNPSAMMITDAFMERSNQQNAGGRFEYEVARVTLQAERPAGRRHPR